MDDKLDVETEHVEKLTRTKKAAIEDSMSTDDSLDDTELYDTSHSGVADSGDLEFGSVTSDNTVQVSDLKSSNESDSNDMSCRESSLHYPTDTAALTNNGQDGHLEFSNRDRTQGGDMFELSSDSKVNDFTLDNQPNEYGQGDSSGSCVVETHEDLQDINGESAKSILNESSSAQTGAATDPNLHQITLNNNGIDLNDHPVEMIDNHHNKDFGEIDDSNDAVKDVEVSMGNGQVDVDPVVGVIKEAVLEENNSSVCVDHIDRTELKSDIQTPASVGDSRVLPMDTSLTDDVVPRVENVCVDLSSSCHNTQNEDDTALACSEDVVNELCEDPTSISKLNCSASAQTHAESVPTEASSTENISLDSDYAADVLHSNHNGKKHCEDNSVLGEMEVGSENSSSIAVTKSVSETCELSTELSTSSSDELVRQTDDLCIGKDLYVHTGDTSEPAPELGDGQHTVEKLHSGINEQMGHQAESNLLLQPSADIESSTQTEQQTTNVKTNADSWLYLLGHDKLKKRVLKPGVEGKRPDFGNLVTIRTIGRLENGTVIDRHDSLQLVVGDGDFIQAFDVCIPHMDKGEVCELVTDARFAYGEIGRQPDVPPNSSATYEIELVSYEDQPSFSKLPVVDRIRLSNIKRERGNYLYSRNECSRAIDAYSKALKIIDDSTESHSGDSSELQLLVDTRVKCYNNLAAAQLKLEVWDEALYSSDQVLRVQPNNVKALYRKGKCLAKKGEQEGAVICLRKAAKLDPETKSIQQELARLEKWIVDQKKSQKAMYEKMLGSKKRPVDATKHEGSKSWWLFGFAATALAVSATFAMYRRLHA